MTLTYRGVSYNLSVAGTSIDREMTGQYRGISYQIQPYPAMPQITQELKYRGVAYIPGVTHRGTSTDGDMFWSPAIA
jgi:hypothetical protein